MRLRRSSTSFALAGASPWSSWTTWPGHPGTFDLAHELEEKGASLRVLEPAIDTGGPMGGMVLTVLGMVAEMELGFIRDRQRAGIDAAKAKGVYKGRPVTFDRVRIVALRKEGMGATEIAKAVACKRGNVYKALKSAGLN
jgi:DNA invertase Pin-like site-specific DNA recombinase